MDDDPRVQEWLDNLDPNVALDILIQAVTSLAIQSGTSFMMVAVNKGTATTSVVAGTCSEDGCPVCLGRIKLLEGLRETADGIFGKPEDEASEPTPESDKLDDSLALGETRH